MSDLQTLLGKNPVAIVGMASMFARAKNLEEYWENIVEGIDCITEVPESRWSIEDYYDPDPLVPDKTYCKVGGFLPDIDFNPMEFGLPPNILEVTDASQLLALLVARDALIDAGYAPGSDKFTAELKEKTGVVLGVGGGQKLITPLTARLQYPVWRKALQASDIPEEEIEGIIEKMKTAYIPWNENSFPGMLGNVISGRVANRFDLGGINSVVDAACAASLSAIKMGLSELIEGRCDMMLTGGVDTDNSPFMYMSFSKTPAFSQKGSIRPFDHESDGMLIGEGVGMIVCKRLEDAIRDGDRIYATIKGIGSSSDGRFKSVYAPRPKGQALAMQRAYDESGYDASTVGLIEAHGTGTGAGDLSEGESMKMVFGKNDPKVNHVALGSVKSQIGHTKAAAGVAGIIKAALSLHNKVLPGTINVTKPNPNLNVASSPAYVNSETRPWFRKAADIPRRASVSAFGFGGVNLHVALEELSGEQDGKYRTYKTHKIILISGADNSELIEACDNHIKELQGEEAKDYLIRLGIESQSKSIPKKNGRVGFVASSVDEAIDKLNIAVQLLQEKQNESSWEHPLKGVWYRNKAFSTDGKVVALFAGQGSQYVNMGVELAMAYPTIRESFDRTNSTFVKAKEKQLTDFVFPIPVFSAEEREQQEEQLRHTELAQPSIGALTAGMYRLLENAGFTADYYAGHSLGEISALWAAGVLDDQSFHTLVKARGALMGAKQKGDPGSMLAVKANVDALEPFIKSYKDVQVANLNSTSQVILGGGTASIEKLAAELTAEGIVAKILSVSAAFHTPFVEHAHKPFAAKIKSVTFNKTTKKVFSNTTGKAYENKVASYKSTLTKHMLSTVLFKDQVENIYKDGGRIFVEFGPKNILSNLVKEILADKEHVSIALNNNALKDSDVQLREAVVQLVVLGINVQGFDQFQTEYVEPVAKGNISVKISGNNYVSEPTKQKHIQAMSQVTVRSVKAKTDTNQVVVTNIEEDIEMTKQDRERLDKLHADLDSLRGQQNRVEQMLQQLVNIQQAALAPFIQQPIAPLAQTAPPMAAPVAAPTQPVVESTPIVAPTPKPAPVPVTKQPVAPEANQQVTPEPPAPEPVVEQKVTTPEPVVAASSGGSIEEMLLAVIAEKTGYPSEMLELTMDMEADLGIDSIKRVEIFGAMTAANPSVEGVNPQELAELRTLQQIVDYISEKAGGAASTPTPVPVASLPETTPTTTSTPVVSEPVTEQPTTPAPSAPSVAPTSANTGTIEEMLLAVIAEKTGYPSEMLELTMDMEADLGIDSIKRVEIFGAMTAANPSVEGVNPQELAELRTLQQIVDYISEKAGGAPAPDATEVPKPAAVEPTTPAPSAPSVSPTSANTGTIEEMLLTVIAEKTGYPSEMLELTMDMEADLGIDSIKRVEIFGAMTAANPSVEGVNPQELAELRTLQQIVDYISEKAGGAPVPATPVIAEPAAAAVASTPVSASTLPGTTSAVQDNGSIEKMLLEVIAEKTGYPSEMLELTMDMEADLGIDSIKRVEIFGAMTAANPSVEGVNPQELAELRTLQQIVDYISDKAGGTPGAVSEQPEAGLKKKELTTSERGNLLQKQQPTPEFDEITMPVTGKYPNVPRSGVVLKNIPEPDILEVKLEQGEITLVTNDGTAATVELCTELLSRGHSVTVLTYPTDLIKPGKKALPSGIVEIQLSDTRDATIAATISGLKGTVSQFIHMHPHLRFPLGKLGMQFEREKSLIKSVYILAKYLKEPLNGLAEKHRTAFMIVTRMDGALGVQNPGNVSVFGGGLFGLIKCLNLEWNKVFCRGTDLAPGLNAKDAAQKICAELFDADQCITDTSYDVDGKRYTLLAKPMVGIKKGQKIKSSVNSKSVFLVTGGARGVTADCVKQMAVSFKCSFILVGRSELQTTEPDWAVGIKDEIELKRKAMESLIAAGDKPLPKAVQAMVGGVLAKREIEANLEFIVKCGAKVEYVAADVTDVKALKAAVDKGTAKLGSITGIIHGAGRLADKLIENKTEADFDAVFDVKVQGLLAVTQCINIDEIKHVVLFSSVAGFYGNVGQTDYAIANEILNRLAHLFKKNHPDVHVVSINWGAWDSGMVSPELKKIFDENNVSLVPTNEGPYAMIDQLSNVYANQQQVILGGTLPVAKAATDHPLKTYIMHRTLLESANPFLKDHVIQGNAVLPIINASTWMAQSAADLYPGFHLTGAEQVALFKGIVFDGNQQDDYQITVKEIQKSDEFIQVEVTISSDTGATLPTNHYRSLINLANKRPKAPSMPLPDIHSLKPVNPDASIIYKDGTLFHGADFRGVKQIVKLDEGGTLLLCEHEGVDPNRQGQFPVKELNVFLTDVMYQSLLIWIRRYHDCASLPLSTEIVDIFKVLPFGRPFYVLLEVISSDEFGMEADITAFDAETGSVYMKSHNARVTMSKELQWA